MFHSIYQPKPFLMRQCSILFMLANFLKCFTRSYCCCIIFFSWNIPCHGQSNWWTLYFFHKHMIIYRMILPLCWEFCPHYVSAPLAMCTHDQCCDSCCKVGVTRVSHVTGTAIVPFFCYFFSPCLRYLDRYEAD